MSEERWLINSETLVGIADAIRTQLGTSELISPEDFPTLIASISPTPPTPVDKTLMGLKVSKSVSRYPIGSTISANDITCKAVYTDGTEDTVTATFDTSGVSTANVGVTYIGVSYGGFSGKLPITVCDTQAVDDNLLQLDDDDLYYADGVEVHIRDNIIYMNGTSYADSKHYLKLSNGLKYNPSKANTAWKSETLDDITSGNTYSYALFTLSGTIPSGFTNNVRNGNAETILSTSKTPQTLTEDGAYAQFYWGSGSVFDNVALGMKVVSGSTTPTVWTPSGQDNGIEISIGITDFTKTHVIPSKAYLSSLLSDSEYVVMQGIAYHDGYVYAGISKTAGPSNMEYVLAKFDASDGTLIGTSSTDHYLGHCNDVTYCAYDGYLHCVSLDNYGTINRLDTNLNYIDSYQIDLSDKYAQFSGIGALCYDTTKEQFVYLLRGDNKKYAIYEKDHTTFVSLNDVTAQEGTYGGIITDDKYVYQAVHVNNNYNYIYRYDWNFNLVEKLQLAQSGEIETFAWIGNVLKYNVSSGSVRDTPIPKN